MSVNTEDAEETLTQNVGVLIIYFGLASASISLLLLYVFLYLTVKREPNLAREESEQTFLDPSTGKKHVFPSVDDPPTIYMTLVAPAYKEEERLPKMMKETMNYLEERHKRQKGFTYEVIVVNDGSTDHTSKEALKFVSRYGYEKVRVLDFVKNRGKGGAVRMGALSARGERILMLDADGATQIADMENLEKGLDTLVDSHNRPAVAVGSRAHLQGEAVAKRSPFRNFLMYGFHVLVRILCVRGIRDTQCGFKMFTRAAIAPLFQTMHIDRWAFDVELLHIAEKLKIPMVEVAVNWQEIDGSKLVPVFSWLQMGRDILFIRLCYMFGIWSIPVCYQKLKL
eukprot:Em0022g350a